MKDQPKSLGEHLRNRRLVLGLTQKNVARSLGTLREVYECWERDEREPVVSVWPDILAFLGYYPFREDTLADLVLKARRCQGADQKSLAAALGIIHQRFRRWENGKEIPPPCVRERLKQFCNSKLKSLPQPEHRPVELPAGRAHPPAHHDKSPETQDIMPDVWAKAQRTS